MPRPAALCLAWCVPLIRAAGGGRSAVITNEGVECGAAGVHCPPLAAGERELDLPAAATPGLPCPAATQTSLILSVSLTSRKQLDFGVVLLM